MTVAVTVAVDVDVRVDVKVVVPVTELVFVVVTETVDVIEFEGVRDGVLVDVIVLVALIDGVDDADFVSMYTTYTDARMLPLNKLSPADDAMFEMTYA